MNPVERPYAELGTVEGFVASAERDGYGHHILWIRPRIGGDPVKCLLTGNALAIIEQKVIGEVFRGRRVLVSGTVNYKSLGRLSQIQATDVKFYPAKSELPGIDDILDENFTGGLSSEEYLAKLRDGQFSYKPFVLGGDPSDGKRP